MSRNGIYFGPPEIQAFAESAEVPVIIYDPKTVYLDENQQLRPYSECVYGAEFEHITTKRVYLYHKNGNHYELLTPKNNTVPPPPLRTA